MKWTTKKTLSRVVLAAAVAASAVTSAQADSTSLPAYQKTDGVSGNLNSIGSDTLNNLMALWAEAFRTNYPSVNIQIEGNSIISAREVAIYAEFGFEGAVIANNTVDGAAIGISVVNFNEGGRLATVQGNLIRNLKAKRPAGTDPGDSAGVGICVEADAAVTGNVVEGAPGAGISVGS